MRRAAVLTLLLASSCVTPAGRVSSHAELAAPGDSARYIEVNGAFLRVRDVGEQGDALPIVLVHGYGSRLEIWREVQDTLARDRRVIAFDQRGFGKSERLAGEYGPASHASDVIALLDALGIERALLVGHSYGGGVVARAALEAKERVAGLALVDAFLLEEQVPPAFYWAQVPLLGEIIFGAFYQQVPGEKYLLAFHDRQRFLTVEALEESKAVMAAPGSVYAALETVRGMDYAEVENEYDTIDAPVLIVWGEVDRVTPLRQGKRIAGRFDGARFRILPSSGHVPSWEQPKALLQELDAFARAVDGGGR